LDKAPVQIDRTQLPAGWGWADWSEAESTQTVWKGFEQKVMQGFRGKMELQANGLKYGQPVGKEIFSLGKGDDGIAKVRVFKPNPGHRAYCFQDGPIWYVSHFAQKHDGEHDEHVATAKRARAEHLERKKKRGQELKQARGARWNERH